MQEAQYMLYMPEAIELLAKTDRQLERKLHPSPRAKALPYLIYIPLYILAIGFAVNDLLFLWQGQDSMDFWANFAQSLLWPASLVLGFVTFWSDSRTAQYAPVNDLRQAARTGDATLAPIVTESAALTLDPVSTPASRIGPLSRPIKLSHPFIVFAIILPGLAIIAAPLLYIFVSIQAGTLLATALLFLASVFGLLACRAFGPVYVRVDAEGLRWRKLLGGRHHLAWRDAQALIRTGDVSLLMDHHKTTFILYGTECVFTWNINATARRRRVASQSLLRTISLHAGLPLRDVSTEVRRIAYAVRILSSARKPTKQMVNYRFRVLAIAMLPFIVMILLAAAIQINEPGHFERIYTQSHNAAPLYADPLTHPDGDWPLTESIAFENGAYTIKNDQSGFTTLVLAPHRYDQALYEVTVSSQEDLDLPSGAGIAILGSAHPQPMLTFCVTPDGWWSLRWLDHGTDTAGSGDSIRKGDSNAIHRGSSAPNRIAVLVQGSDFTFYINGHYMTRYHDDHLRVATPASTSTKNPGKAPSPTSPSTPLDDQTAIARLVAVHMPPIPLLCPCLTASLPIRIPHLSQNL